MGVRLIWYGCPPASMGVSTPTVEYNSPPMPKTLLEKLCLTLLVLSGTFQDGVVKSSEAFKPEDTTLAPPPSLFMRAAVSGGVSVQEG